MLFVQHGMGSLWWSLVLVVALVSVLSSRALIAWLQDTLAVRSPLFPSSSRADVIVVLGYALFRNGSLTEPLKGRVLHGVRLWEEGGGLQTLIFSGAHPGDGLRIRSEASAMLSYALQVHGTTEMPDTWILESKSTSTRTNAMYSLEIMKPNGWASTIVVTNTFHQLRSLWVFKKAAHDTGMRLKVAMAPMPFIGHQGWGGGPLFNVLVDHVDFWRELAALAWYKHKGYI